MSELKFRAWDTHDNKMIRDSEQAIKLMLVVRPDRYVFLQFTGLLDKNGKKIFEEDIVKIYDSAVGAIEFFYGAWQIQNKEKAGGQLGSISIDHIEIIGNIYENPELLAK